MGVSNGVLWWYWPEAHGYWVSPLGVFLCGTALIADVVYPFLLYEVRQYEISLSDGRLIRGDRRGQIKPKLR